MAQVSATATSVTPSTGHKNCKYPLRSWCFTISNPTPDDESAIRSLDGDQVARLAVGKEIAPTTGTPHLQGYVRFHKSHRQGQVRQLLGGRAHVEPRNGTEPEASKYALKDGDVMINLGTDATPKKEDEDYRSAAKRVIQAIDSGATPRQVWEQNRVFYMFNSQKIVQEFKRAKFYQENPLHTGFAPTDINVYNFHV